MRKLKNTVGYKLIARAIAQFIWNSRSLELLSDTYFSFEFVIDYLKSFNYCWLIAGAPRPNRNL